MKIADLLSKEWVRLVGVLLIGITIGVVFYPSKRVEEKITQKFEQEISTLKEVQSKELKEVNEKLSITSIEKKELHEQSEKKINSLTTEIKNLQSKQKTSYYKLVKPDGTIEIKKFSESEVSESSSVITQIQQEFKTKIDQIDSKYATIHKERIEKIQKDFQSKEVEYQKTIAELSKTKITTTNEKRFGIEAGMDQDKNYYGHATADLWGPVFLGVHGQINKTDSKLGAGIGVRF